MIGGLKKSETQRIELIQNGQVKLFFRAFDEKVSFIQNIFSKIFNSILYEVFKFKSTPKNISIHSRQIMI